MNVFPYSFTTEKRGNSLYGVDSLDNSLSWMCNILIRFELKSLYKIKNDAEWRRLK